MNFLQAIILGIVQGLTEFIPISSTAHLVFASRWTNIYNGNPEQITATMAVIQLGTLAAVFVYFAQDIRRHFTVAFLRDHWALLRKKRGMRFSGTHGVRPIWLSEEAWLGWLIIIGSIPIGTVGLYFKDLIESGDEKFVGNCDDDDRRRGFVDFRRTRRQSAQRIARFRFARRARRRFRAGSRAVPGASRVRVRRLWADFSPGKNAKRRRVFRFC
jgi:hypothetical protein